jgi:hypothetical protein
VDSSVRAPTNCLPASRAGGEELAMSTLEIEFGLDSPAYVSVDEVGQPLDGDVVIRNTVEEGVFADAARHRLVQHQRAGPASVRR